MPQWYSAGVPPPERPSRAGIGRRRGGRNLQERRNRIGQKSIRTKRLRNCPEFLGALALYSTERTGQTIKPQAGKK